jgi:hypothetical protein
MAEDPAPKRKSDGNDARFGKLEEFRDLLNEIRYSSSPIYNIQLLHVNKLI